MLSCKQVFICQAFHTHIGAMLSFKRVAIFQAYHAHINAIFQAGGYLSSLSYTYRSNAIFQEQMAIFQAYHALMNAIFLAVGYLSSLSCTYTMLSFKRVAIFQASQSCSIEFYLSICVGGLKHCHCRFQMVKRPPVMQTFPSRWLSFKPLSHAVWSPTLLSASKD